MRVGVSSRATTLGEKLLLPEVELELLVSLHDDSQIALVLEEEGVLGSLVLDTPTVVALLDDTRDCGRVDHVEAAELQSLLRVLTDGVQDLDRRGDLETHGARGVDDCVHDVGKTVIGASALIVDHESRAASKDVQCPLGGSAHHRVREAVVRAVALVFVTCHKCTSC